MGNWRRVQLIGTCDLAEVPALKEATRFDLKGPNFHCLMSDTGIGGLPMWAKPRIEAVGNLAERDYTVQDVADCLTELSVIAPSLNLKAHCGEDNEGDKCEATVTLAFGKVQVGIPEIETIPEVELGQMGANLVGWLFRSGQM